ncbi:MAG: hypothetical protein EOP86_20405 [Verrucomicrobiaceae bacterium]|nr:MAG: hypothetical protein EOP86_20405 [Verrucomicrobiaceae bacterium]
MTLEEWQDLMDRDPEESRTEDMAHMARVRQLARGLSLKDLRARIEAGMEETISKQSVSTLLGTLIQEFARRDAAQACDFLFRKKYWRSTGNVFEEWGRQDPQAALAWIDAHTVEAHSEFKGGRYQIIRGWAENSPAAAFEMMVDLNQKGKLDISDEDKVGPGSRFKFFTSWAKKDPEAAVAVSTSHPELAFCRNAHWRNALYEINPEQRGRLLAAIQSIADPELKAPAFTECAVFFAGSDDPLKAIPFTQDQSLPDYERDQMRQLVLEAWVQRSHPEDAAQWFWNSTPPGQETDALKKVMGAWSECGGRLDGALAWLQSLPPDRLPAGAPQIFAMAGFPMDPVSALRGWLALQSAGEFTFDATARLGQYLSSAPQATRLPALLREAGFPTELTASILAAAGQREE